MNLGTEGIALIKYSESLKLKTYQCSAGKWTIGYGDTGPGVVPGLQITEAEAETRLHHRMSKEFVPGVRRGLRVPVTQHQFDALVSLAYNIGVHAFQTSTLLRKLNAGDVTGAVEQFEVWNKETIPGTKIKRVSDGLVKRRALERALFEGKDWRALAQELDAAHAAKRKQQRHAVKDRRA